MLLLATVSVDVAGARNNPPPNVRFGSLAAEMIGTVRRPNVRSNRSCDCARIASARIAALSVFHAESSPAVSSYCKTENCCLSIGVVTVALHGCQSTSLLTRAFHHAMREPSDGDQISTQVRNERCRHAQRNGTGRNLLRIRRE